MSSEKMTFSIRVEIELNQLNGVLEMYAFVPYSPCSGEGVKYIKQLIAYPAKWEVDEFVKAMNGKTGIGVASGTDG